MTSSSSISSSRTKRERSSWAASIGATHCTVEHVGLVLSGQADAAMADGTIHHLTAGTLFYIPPEPHDRWVVGDEPYVSLHILGAAVYAIANHEDH